MPENNISKINMQFKRLQLKLNYIPRGDWLACFCLHPHSCILKARTAGPADGFACLLLSYLGSIVANLPLYFIFRNDHDKEHFFLLIQLQVYLIEEIQKISSMLIWELSYFSCTLINCYLTVIVLLTSNFHRMRQ